MINTLLFSCLFFILVSIYPVKSGYFANSNSEPISDVQQREENDLVSIVELGEIMIGSSYPHNFFLDDDALTYFNLSN